MLTPPATGVQFEGVSKSYGVVQALAGVSFAVRAGSVHALLGENGAGKSTLLKVLSGAIRPTAGALRIDGRPRVFTSPTQAIAAGVAVIYQELHLVAELSVAESLLLGHLPSAHGFVDVRRLRAEAARLMAPLDASIDPATPVGRLPIGQRQMVEIAKALSRGARIIAFDEPTSSLSARETERLFDVVRDLRGRGCAVLYVSHRLEEVFSICDAATVLRDGRHVTTLDTLQGVGADEIVRAMVGRDIKDIYAHQPRAVGAPVLAVEDLRGTGLAGPVSLVVRAGEIVGLFGLVGAGRSELLRLIYGAARPVAGTIRVGGQPVRVVTPGDALRAGIVLCPEDRKKEAILPIRSVLENINISARRRRATLGLMIDGRWERRNANERVRQLDVRTPTLEQPVSHLSGGNQQKVVLARGLSLPVRVLLLDEPTRGIDVGAKRELYAIMYELARRGLGVLMVSSELPEVLGVSDRVLIMRQGRLAGEVSRAEATPEGVLRLALPQAK